MSSTQDLLKQQFPQLKFKNDFVLGPVTYFKIGGPAEVYLELDDLEIVRQVVNFCRTELIPLTMLGGASNVVVADEGIKGLVLHLTNTAVELSEDEFEGKRVVLAGAGIKTALLVSQTVDLGFQGLEYFLGVPGTLGGATYNNAHYLSDLVGEHIYRVEIINSHGEFEWLTNDQCEFGYDRSRFQKTKEIITRVEFILAAGDRETSQAKIKEATLYRAQTQPLGMPSSGCIFQNAPNTPDLQQRFPQFADKKFVPGGFLIDQAGLKGTREGEIEVSQKHAAFFVNHGQGTARDVQTLVDKVKSSVKAQFGVELHEEVFYLH
jgi:UDP-N-acetylmuramate dehydrogenase